MHILHIIFDDRLDLAPVLALCAAHGDAVGAPKPVAACLEGSPLAGLLAEAGVAVLPLPGVKAWYPGVWRRIARAHRTYNFSIVHSHDALAARLAAKCRKVWAKARWAHTWWARPVFKQAKELERFKPADSLTALNHEAARYLETVGADSRRLTVIPAGIDPAGYALHAAPEEAGINIAALGPLIADSGQEILLAALVLLKTAHPELTWELRLAGEGPLFDKLLRQADVAGIAEHMGLLGSQQACDLLAHCDMLVAPDVRGEHGCKAIKQAWAAGLPVICSDLPVHQEMVNNEHNGLLVPRHNSEALAARLAELALNPQLRHNLAQAGRQSLKKYTVKTMVETYTKLYTQLAAVEAVN